MDSNLVIRALGALAHESRLAVFRLLVQAGHEIPAGEIAGALSITPQALSFHLKDLVHADLIEPRYEGRRIFYRAKYPTMTGLIEFLTDNCCVGAPCGIPSSNACCD
jgi:DNA-binding transcriptional ArsR family regulator